MSDNKDATVDTEEFDIDIDGMDDDQLVAFEQLLVEEYSNLRGSDEFSAEDLEVRTATREDLKTVADAIKMAREELSERSEQNALDDLVSEEFEYVAKEEPVEEEAAEEELADEEADEDEVVEEEAAEEELSDEDDVTISPKGLTSDEGAESVKKEFNVVASADVRGFRAGQDLANWSGVAAALMAKRGDVRGTDEGRDGSRFLVASVIGEYPEERQLSDDMDSNMAKINAVASQEAITASGGLCAPLTPYYQLTTYGDSHRPVRDALPQFQASRGGIRFMPAPVLSDLAGSTRHTTAAEDAAGYTNQDPAGTTDPKPCLHVTCPAEQSAVVEAIHRCLTFGNMGARTYPEQVEAWVKLGMAEFSRYAETRLIDAIQAASTAVTGAQIYGAVDSVLDQVSLVVNSFRARHRLRGDAAMRVLMPFWVLDLLKTDMAGQGPGDGLGRYSVSDAQISDWLKSRGVTVTFYQDNSTTAGAPFAAPSAAPIEDWPGTFEWFVYPEGSFLYLDSGNLDLGLVRDSTLNSQNDYQVFYEEFNTVVFTGVESLAVTSTIVPNSASVAQTNTDAGVVALRT